MEGFICMTQWNGTNEIELCIVKWLNDEIVSSYALLLHFLCSYPVKVAIQIVYLRVSLFTVKENNVIDDIYEMSGGEVRLNFEEPYGEVRDDVSGGESR